MASDLQIAANRDNAKLSTGPTSEAGKATSSRNHTTHNLTAKGLIIPPALEDAFAHHQAQLRNSLVPNGELQEILFARLLECSWNLHRCRLAEQQLYQTTTVDPLLDDSNAPKYDRIQKYARQYESSLHKSLRALAVLQTEAAFRQEVAPITEDTPQEEYEATPHVLSEACSYSKVLANMAKATSQKPESPRTTTERYLESLMSRPDLASKWKDPTLVDEDV